jgi:hypothetical protein
MATVVLFAAGAWAQPMQGGPMNGGPMMGMPDGGQPWPVYQRRGFPGGYGGYGYGPQVSGSYFQRPYPYHLDYYKMRYGGSYAPYYGNLYGPSNSFYPPQYQGDYGPNYHGPNNANNGYPPSGGQYGNGCGQWCWCWVPCSGNTSYGAGPVDPAAAVPEGAIEQSSGATNQSPSAGAAAATPALLPAH